MDEKKLKEAIADLQNMENIEAAILKIHEVKRDLYAIPATCHPEKGTVALRRGPNNELRRMCEECMKTLK